MSLINLFNRRVKEADGYFHLLDMIAKKQVKVANHLFTRTIQSFYRYDIKKKYNITNDRIVEIEITTLCNLKCINCDRSCRQAPSREQMSITQIEKFIDESLRYHWNWDKIRLIGGEPTLHKKLMSIIEIVWRYKNVYENCDIDVVTNGFGNKVNDVLSQLPDWIGVINSSKSIQNPYLWSTYNFAPIDLVGYRDEKDFSKGCGVTSECGLGLTTYGYYPCGAGASIDRIFGFDIGLKDLSLVRPRLLRKQLRILCKYCGHYKRGPPKYSMNHGEIISPTWRIAYGEYKKKRPDLSIY